MAEGSAAPLTGTGAPGGATTSSGTDGPPRTAGATAPGGWGGSTPPVPAWLVVATAVSWRVLVVSAAVFMVLLLLSRLYLPMIPVILALLATTLLHPPAAALKQRGWPPALAAALVVASALTLLVGLGMVVVPQVSAELADFNDAVVEGWEAIVAWMIDGPMGLTQAQIDGYIERAMAQLRANAGPVASGVLSGAVLAVEVVVGFVLAVVLTFFFVKDGPRIWRWLVEHVPMERRGDVEALGERAWSTLGGYLRGTAVVAAVDAVGIGLGLVVIGVPLVLPLMLLTFFGGFFPVVGATVAGFVAVAVAAVAGGLVDAALVLAVVVGVQQLESNVLEPVVLSRAVRLHPVVILVALTAGGVVAGVIGAFLAVPLAAILSAMGNELRLRRLGSPLVVPTGVQRGGPTA